MMQENELELETIIDSLRALSIAITELPKDLNDEDESSFKIFWHNVIEDVIQKLKRYDEQEEKS